MHFKSTDYINHIREQSFCCACMKTTTALDPHHIDTIGMGGNRKKESKKHFSCIPLCRKCHREYHDKGKTQFQKDKDINVYELIHYYFSNFIWTILSREIQ
tara:strand:- start:18 stop:320 length:303 start_codon:yes stop_codon:yes gene_type:complete